MLQPADSIRDASPSFCPNAKPHSHAVHPGTGANEVSDRVMAGEWVLNAGHMFVVGTDEVTIQDS